MESYTLILSPDPDIGGFAVIMPALPGALTQGDTRDEALKNAREAARLWLEASAAHGEGPLRETPQLIAEAVASVIADRDEAGWNHDLELTTMPAPALSAA